MFRSAAVKLTFWYLLIIMVLSIGCSLALYRISSNDIERIAKVQFSFLNSLLGPLDADNYLHLRQHQLSEDRQKLRANLIVFNIGVLVVGGITSYALARRTLRPIESALESQSRFAADASHELRTPLTVMQTENEVAMRNRNLSKEQAVALLKSNLEEVGKLKALSEGLLALAKTAKNEELMDEVALQKAIDEAIQRVSKVANAKKIKIISPKTNVKAKGNFEQIVQLLTILLDNAIKYSHDGSKVNLKAEKKERQAQITVEDSGKGISRSDLPRIFDRFYRADSSRSKNEASGYGLGLAIAKKIVDLHGGTIAAKSTPGKGSSFTVKLPQNNTYRG